LVLFLILELVELPGRLPVGDTSPAPLVGDVTLVLAMTRMCGVGVDFSSGPSQGERSMCEDDGGQRGMDG
jgi:hypothetical protein